MTTKKKRPKGAKARHVKHSTAWRVAQRAYQRRWREEHPGYFRRWYKKNKKRMLTLKRRWRANPANARHETLTRKART